MFIKAASSSSKDEARIVMATSPSAATPAADKVREFIFGDHDFQELRNLVKRVSGISLSDSKRELVYGRVSRRLRALGLDSFAAYRDRLAAGDPNELVEFCNALTTNLTSFFREPHHFDYLRDRLLLPRLADASSPRRIRIWSAACSTGEEPYSIAMTVCESIPDWRRWDIRILATDIDSQVLGHARAGVYTADRVRGIDPRRLHSYFKERRQGGEPGYQVAPELASLITFKHLNLMQPLPMSGPLDVIICRNVVIYFDKETQRDLFARMSQLQRPGDLLFIGHSESLFKVCDDYTLVGKTTYRRK
jgi:chemotaxis protein methyltransferase CheR